MAGADDVGVFALIVIVFFAGVAIQSEACGTEYNFNHIKLCASACQNNDGLKFLDTVGDCECNNGAEFNIEKLLPAEKENNE